MPSIRIIGIRPGEKLHEVLLTEDEARHSYDLGDRYVISRIATAPRRASAAERLADGFRYASDSNDDWLDSEGLLAMTNPVAPARRAADLQAAQPGWEA